MTLYEIEWLERKRGTLYIEADSEEAARYGAEVLPESEYAKSLTREDFAFVTVTEVRS